MPDQPEPARLAVQCAGCGRALSVDAAFCAGCGRATHVGLRAVGERTRRESHLAARSVLAIATTFGGVLAVLLGAHLLSARPAVHFLASEAGLLAVGVLAVLVQGGDAWRASLAGPSRAGALALGLGVGLVAIALNLGYVELLGLAFGEAEPLPPEARPPLFLQLASVVVLAAFGEEWLCRGVLWQALERVAPAGVTLLLSALLFGLLHALNGGFLLEVPHRFAFGLLLGWLRLRTGSLGPCVIAHGTNNLAFVLFG